MTLSEILKAARAKIENPKNWIKGNVALDASGSAVDPLNPAACRFCGIGALRASGAPIRDYWAALNYLEAVEPVSDNHFWIYNDAAKTTHKQVLKAFTAAIAKAEGEGK